MHRLLALVALLLGNLTLANPSPIVFLHGIKGAVLKHSQTGDVHWIGGLAALGLSTPELALKAEWSGAGRQPVDDLRPERVLDAIRFIPGILEFGVYGKWLRAAEASGHSFHPFAYDWRRELSETVEDLEKFVDKVVTTNAGAKVTAVAHSMGGLVLFSLAARRPELFAGLVFAGVPFTGGIGFLPDVHVGAKEGLNAKILSPDVLATFPSVYTLFPMEPVDSMGGDSTDLSSINEWKRQNLSYYAPNRQAPAGWDKFLQGALDRAKAFRKTLAAKKTMPPILAVMANAHPTLDRAKATAKGWDFENEPKVPGDGRVRAASMAPPGVPFEAVLTTNSHAALLDDPLVQKRIFALP